MQIYFYFAKSCILLYISGLTDSQINDSNIEKASKNSSDYTSKCVVLTRVLIITFFMLRLALFLICY